MAKREKTVMVCEIPAIAAHYTESIGPLPVYRNETFVVTAREADAYELFGMARRATVDEVKAAEDMAAMRARLAEEAAAKADADDAALAAEAAAAAEAERAERAEMERALTAE